MRGTRLRPVLMAAASALLAACGSASSPAHFGQGPTVVCGQTIISSAAQVSSLAVPTAPTYRVPTGSLSAASQLPIVLLLSTDCAAGAEVTDDSPAILRLGTAVRGTRSGVVAVLVYGLRQGAGLLTVSRPSGPRTEVSIPVA